MSVSSRLDDPGNGLRDNGRHVLTYSMLKSTFEDPDGRDPGREIELHLTGHMEKFSWGFNGQKFSDVEPLRLNYGERMRIVLVNDTMMTHPIHLHGMWSDVRTTTATSWCASTRWICRQVADARIACVPMRWAAGRSIATCFITWKPE